MEALFFGLGYSSRAATHALRDAVPEGLRLHGTTRSLEKAETLKLDGIIGHQFDGAAQSPSLNAAIASATHIIHSIAPDANGDAVLNHFRDELMHCENLQWLCYYSTVGVYGNFDGAWIDETAACNPLNQRSQWRVKAENDWQDFAAEKGIPLTILRLAGIYGPGRSTFDKLQNGTSKRINKPGQVFNRIHVADIARVTSLAALEKLNGTFNLADDLPFAPHDVVTYAANMLGITPPPEENFSTAEMTPMARSFYADNKRVSNGAIKKALGIDLLYPTFREGLSAIHNGKNI